MFSDIANHWARPCIVALSARGILGGYPNGTFRPKATVSRAEFAAIMPKVFPDLLAQQKPLAFRDVRAAYWASKAIAWATERKLFSGYEDGTFRPRQSVSRAQSIVVLMLGLEATQGFDTTTIPVDEPVAERNLVGEQFSDVAEIPAYARKAIAAAVNRQLLEQLKEPRSLQPNKSITRGEVAALLCRVLEIPGSALAIDYPTLNAAQDTQAIFRRFLQQESGFDQSKLAFLDRSIQASPYRGNIAKYAARLQTPDAISKALANAAPYPTTGDVFFVNEGGLEFLSPDILSACVCVAAEQNGELQGRWLGRDALSDRQMWSSTKFIPLLNVAARANAIAPTTDIDNCRVRAAGSTGRFSGFPFHDLAAGIMTYDNRIATSNSLAVMFKNFETPERLEKWTQQMTGSQSLSFQGRYGEVPFIELPELYSSPARKVLLKSPKAEHSGQNLMSTYDLTRLITMAGWHWRLPAQSRIPNLQTHSLESIIRAVGVDTARYVDVALRALGLDQVMRSPVIISKSGFGRSDRRDRTELTYCALAQFSLPRQIASPNIGAPDPTAAYQNYSVGFTLIAAQNVGDADEEARYVDALMAASVTEIIRRVALGDL